jgi:hypothetical protein
MPKAPVLLLFCLTALCACSRRQQLAPSPTPTAVGRAVDGGAGELDADAAALPTPGPGTGRYTVKPGDSLWEIAGSEAVMGDAFRWPLLYRQNRDEIVDPDLIEPAQRLKFRKNYSPDEIERAVKAAQDTPPYEPHNSVQRRPALEY